MTEKKYTWHKIADHINELSFADNDIAVAEMNGKKICIAKFKEGVFAFSYKCPHAGGILADGYIDALGHVVCPFVEFLVRRIEEAGPQHQRRRILFKTLACGTET